MPAHIVYGALEQVFPKRVVTRSRHAAPLLQHHTSRRHARRFFLSSAELGRPARGPSVALSARRIPYLEQSFNISPQTADNAAGARLSRLTGQYHERTISS